MAGFLIHKKSNVTVFWMQKSGCTFLKNLFYALAVGNAYSNPQRIHSDRFARHRIKFRPFWHKIDPDISFVVVRDPVARVCSFYWNKINSRAPDLKSKLRETLSRLAKLDHPSFRGFTEQRGETLDEHRYLFGLMLDAIGHVFADEERKFLNGHFARQNEMILAGGAKGLPVVALEQLHHSIPASVVDRIPELVTVLKGMPRMNESKKAFSAEELLTPELRTRIMNLYSQDVILHSKAIAANLVAE
ncbi:MAG: sulfotransferase family 2 domain-containing protein [Rhodobacteraceae bacterium]|nr:sulfotransferase family 2 domain-containing protein [Paracoccaceae bacterium]